MIGSLHQTLCSLQGLSNKINEFLNKHKIVQLTMKSKIETIKARCSPFDRYNVVKASLALLFLFVPSASVVYAQQDYKKSDDNNTDLSLLMTNYNALREEGQGFFLVDASLNYENPPAGIVAFSVAVHWWCDLEFSSDDADTTNYGYVGR